MGKAEGRVVGLWPGSCLHAVRTLEHPRWEDYEYEPLDESKTKNRFYWLGDGSTHNEKYMSGDRALLLILKRNLTYHLSIGAWYLNQEEIDIPPSTHSRSSANPVY